MKDYWDEIDALVPTTGCSCEASRPSIELLRNQCLLQFLMGLNESFSHVRSDILLKTPVLTINQAYALVIQEESQRGLGVADGSRDSMTMMVGRHQNQRSNTTPPTSHQYQMNQYPNYNQNQNYKSRRPLAPPGSVCDHCGYKGHLRTNCYRLVGYPPDFQSKKNLGSAGVPTKPYASSNVAEVERTNDVKGQGRNDMKGQGRYISEDHYQELIGRGNKASTSGDFQAHMAGIFALLSNAFSHTWIIDSGASHHITFDRECLDEVFKTTSSGENGGVQVLNGGRCEVTHTGSTKILRSHKLKNVLFVPDFKFNLLSVSKLTRDLSCSVSFYPEFCVF